MLSGKTRGGGYKGQGYTYLDLDKSKTAESKVVDSARPGMGEEWQTMENRKGEYEVVELETEGMIDSDSAILMGTTSYAKPMR